MKEFSANGLSCEYLRNPIGIDVHSPRLSWRIESAERSQRQTAYRILVASAKSTLNSNEGDLWDSGKIASDETLHIVYRGKPLSSYQRCYWKVKVWNTRDVDSPWSKFASWSMGILSADEWKGCWLGYTRRYSGNEELELKGTWKQEAPSPLFRKTFEIRKEVVYAALHVCGLGFYEAYLNGSRIGDHVLDPAFTRYDRTCLYVTYDVTSMLKPGPNVLGVMLGNGWYNMFSNDAWKFNEAPWRDRPKMLVQLRIEYADGASELIVSDKSWKAATGPILLDGIRQGECYDARREQPGWADKVRS